MALENYDAIGEWRDRQNGEGMRGDKDSPALDVSGKLPDGTEFKTVQEFKTALLSHKQAFVKGLHGEIALLCPGAAAGVWRSRRLWTRSCADAAKNDDRLQEIIQATVASSFFLTR